MVALGLVAMAAAADVLRVGALCHCPQAAPPGHHPTLVAATVSTTASISISGSGSRGTLGYRLRTFASADDSSSAPVSTSDPPSSSNSGDDDEFEARLAKLRKRSGSGTGKKAEERKARKEGADPYSTAPPSSSSSAPSSPPAIETLPPTPLEDAVSGGLPVRLGFTPYSERVNGGAALVGLAALVAVELASGQSLFSYHDGATVGVQLYVVLGLGALWVKMEKERSSVWPK